MTQIKVKLKLRIETSKVGVNWNAVLDTGDRTCAVLKLSVLPQWHLVGFWSFTMIDRGVLTTWPIAGPTVRPMVVNLLPRPDIPSHQRPSRTDYTPSRYDSAISRSPTPPPHNSPDHSATCYLCKRSILHSTFIIIRIISKRTNRCNRRRLELCKTLHQHVEGDQTCWNAFRKWC